MERLSVLIPVYNSEDTIARLCSSLIEILSAEIDLEIVLVNDGSMDRSDEVCTEIHNNYPGIVTYLELSRNFGEHNALIAGFNFVTGDYCITMDDDLQNSPEDVKKLLEKIRSGFDVVYTSYMTKQDSLFRRIGSCFNDKVANIVIRKPADLYLSSFKIVNKFIINEIIKFDGPDPYIDGIILRSTTRIGKVQVEHHSRLSGQSGYTLSKLVSLWSSMILNFSIIPLRITGLFGLVLCTNTLVYVVHKTFFDKPYGNLTEHQTEMSVMMFLFGILFLGIGLISEYIGKIHLLLYKNPQFIVRRMMTRSDS